MPNPPKTLTEKELAEVEMMAGLGMRFEDIALTKDMCLDTLKKYADPQLQQGKAKTKAQVMQTAFKMAVSGKTPAMTMFWLKTQAGWREKPVESTQGNELVLSIRDSNRPTQAVTTFLAETLEKVSQGEIEPKTASSIATIAGAFMKAVAQSSLEERLTLLESAREQRDTDSLNLDL